MKLLVEGRTIALSPQMAIGKGGEADVYRIDEDTALKVFKSPDHPDFSGMPEEQQAASVRLAINQHKLPLFPRGLPEQVLSPRELATSPRTGMIAGYTMRYLKDATVIRALASADYDGCGKNDVVAIFLELLGLMQALHDRQIVIGDFNDLNILVARGKPFIIDTDSFQFGSYPCGVFSPRFLDPLLCDSGSSVYRQVKPYNVSSDWYAYAVMLMQTLLYVGPYGGIYLPEDPSMRISQELRPLRRISVFHDKVKYPSSALHYSVLPDEITHYFQQVFLNDRREPLPSALMTSLLWKKCPSCGSEHARSICPDCVFTMAVRSVPRQSESIEKACIFRTTGRIVSSAVFRGRLLWLYEEDGIFYREEGREVFRGAHHGGMKYALAGEKTVIGQGSSMVILTPGAVPLRHHVDTFAMSPAFDAYEKEIYMITRGRMACLQENHETMLGEVLEGQTYFKPGPAFGLGFYRAGGICNAFSFDRQSRRIRENLVIPHLRKNVQDVSCFFSGDYCWFFLVTEEQGRTIHRCLLISSQGTIEACEEALGGDGSWLGLPPSRGRCAAGEYLFVLTGDGLCRVEKKGTSLIVAREFSYPAGFVPENSLLHQGKGGFYAITAKEIMFLTLRSRQNAMPGGGLPGLKGEGGIS